MVVAKVLEVVTAHDQKCNKHPLLPRGRGGIRVPESIARSFRWQGHGIITSFGCRPLSLEAGVLGIR